MLSAPTHTCAVLWSVCGVKFIELHLNYDLATSPETTLKPLKIFLKVGRNFGKESFLQLPLKTIYRYA